MVKSLSPVFRLSLGITSLIVSLVMAAQFFGLVPDTIGEKLKARARLSEALTIQLSSAAAKNDIDAVKLISATVVERDEEILSIGLRRVNGELVTQTEEHSHFWRSNEEIASSPRLVHVPLFNGTQPWGRVEMTFRDIDPAATWTGIPQAILLLIAYMAVSGFCGVYFLLRRALRSLNPGKVVPGRVQSAFDTLAEGVAIIDEKERILLANKVLVETTKMSQESLIGKNIGDLPWRRWERDNDAKPPDLPWQTAIAKKASSVQVPMGLRLSNDDIQSYNINASCIIDGDNKATGAIVTLSDVTLLEKRNASLAHAVNKLKASEEEITKQNLELRFLANHDPLTGILNRRSLFEGFEKKFLNAIANGSNLTCLMVDLDHFKSINDTYGHAVGDDVIAGCANILGSVCRNEDIVGRYGGEEFCVVFDGLPNKTCLEIAERIRQDVQARSATWLKQGKNVSVSIGFATIESGAKSPDELVEQADQALYHAKHSGRNRVIEWSDSLGQETDKASTDTGINDGKQHPVPPMQAPVETPAPAANVSQNQHNTDPLTGMPQLTTFKERVMVSIDRAKRQGKSVAVINLSIDSISQIMDVFGSQEAMRVLRLAGERISKLLRRSDTVALLNGKDRLVSYSRNGEHSFLIEIAHLDEIASVTWILQRMFATLAEPYTLQEKEYYMRYSAGVSVFPEDGVDADRLINHAGLAQKHAVRDGKANQFEFYSENMSDVAKQQLLIEVGIREAIEQNQFQLNYQPIIGLESGRLVNTEALLRCNNPKLEGIPIDMLIAVSEQTGLMEDIGSWVISEATRQLAEWHSRNIKLPSLSINVSALQFASEASAGRLVSSILDAPCSPSCIQLEVTETAILKDMDGAAKVLQQLQRLGVKIALDDFGTGQSSLAYIQKLHPDTVKIDKSFVEDIDINRSNKALVAAVTELSSRLGLRVVAEGVENLDQVDVLKELGCTEIQGYLISPPMPKHAYTEWLELFAGSGSKAVSVDQLRSA